MKQRNDKTSVARQPLAGQKGDRAEPKKSGIKPDIPITDIAYVDHDDLGNAIWTLRPRIPGRSDDDPTLDAIKYLDVDGLEVQDDGDDPCSGSCDPYDRG